MEARSDNVGHLTDYSAISAGLYSLVNYKATPLILIFWISSAAIGLSSKWAPIVFIGIKTI